MVGFVSHKDGSSAFAIQQWGGITQRGEPMLAAHPETIAFVQACQAMFGTQILMQQQLLERSKTIV